MGTSKQEIREWLKRAIKEGNNTHVMVICDTFDWEDYPVFVSKDEDIMEKINEYNEKNMQSIMEIYNLSMDIEPQLNEPRARNI